MGLDMYLTRRYYVKNWDHMKPEEKHHITIKKGNAESDIDTEKISYVETEEIYWRKANAIHKWFVDNCQGGVDDCREAWVSRKQLEELLGLVNEVLESTTLVGSWIQAGLKMVKTKSGKIKEVPVKQRGKKLKDPSTAAHLLPSQPGFFFGGYEYDQYYWEDLKYTKKELERILKNKEDDGEFYYHSSW